MRWGILGASCMLALLAGACTKSDPTVEQLEGAEPQRLSFGSPQEVQSAFTRQMQSCWFDGPQAPLTGYSYQIQPLRMETAEGERQLQQIAIQSGSDKPDFVIQFFPFNQNTLISTRNLALPAELARRLKRDIETWIFGRQSCDGGAAAIGRTQEPGLGAPTSSAISKGNASRSDWQTESEPTGGWDAAQERPPNRSGIY